MHRTWLLLLPILASTLTSCGGGKSNLPADQQALADDVKSRGGLYYTDREQPELGVVGLNLQGTNADDALVGRLTTFPELQTLVLTNTKITDAAVPLLQKLKKLTMLDVTDTKLSEKAKETLRAVFAEIELIGAQPPEPEPEEPQ